MLHSHTGLSFDTTGYAVPKLPSSWGKVGPARKADNLPPSVSRLSRNCWSLDVSQPYRPPRPVTGIALQFLSDSCRFFFWIRIISNFADKVRIY
jgi:hypothetical protein